MAEVQIIAELMQHVTDQFMAVIAEYIIGLAAAAQKYLGAPVLISPFCRLGQCGQGKRRAGGSHQFYFIEEIDLLP